MDWSTLRGGRALSVPDRLSVDLERVILDGSLSAGDRLPSERELCELLGVSRVSVRQALHELEARGLIDRRRGRGTIVLSAADGAGDVGSAIAAMLGSVSSTTLELARIMELRALIEPPIAALAAARVTERDIEQLRQLVEEMEAEQDLVRYPDLDRAFHQAIAVDTHNPLFTQLTDLIAVQIAPSRRRTLQTVARREASSAAHRRIFEAIARHDAVAAESEARAHVETVLRISLNPAASDAAEETTR
jgi:GntR family transcriptional repressor for pyruvate dehydrogenase complex